MRDSTQKTVILCADDYAISPGVSRAICELLKGRRLSATGVMATSSFWPEHADWIKPFRDHADIGLHLTLTQARPASGGEFLAPLGKMPRLMPEGYFPPLGQLMRMAFFGQLDPVEIQDEFNRQIDVFEKHVGSPPAFLDGHHHIQQLPVVRDVVARVCSERLGDSGYVRVCWEPPELVLRRRVDVLKALVIGFPGRALKRKLQQGKINFNKGFSGIYAPSPEADYPVMFRRFLRGVKEGTVILCHPGSVDKELEAADEMTTPREAELRFFQSDDFPKTLESARVRLGRFLDCFGSAS